MINLAGSKRQLRTCVAFGAVMAIGLTGPAFAQEDSQGSEDSEIVVTGARAENRGIVDEKIGTTGIADFLSSDEAGKLPDLNIAESLSRIPGVSAVFDEDRARFVTVRGLKSSLNYQAIDGIGIATTDDFGGTGRQVNLEVIPPGAVGLMEVRKTFTPEVDGGAIGGYINLRTRSAFDRRRRGLILQAGLNLQTYKAVPGSNNVGGPLNSPVGVDLDATYVGRFGADERFGIVFTAQFNQDSRDESKNVQASEAFYSASGVSVPPLLNDGSVNPAWNGLAVPREVRSFDYTNRVRNYGGNLKLEYKLDGIHASLLGFYYADRQEETRKMMQVFGMASPRNLTSTSGDLTYGEVRSGWNSNNLNKDNAGLIGSLALDLGERSRLRLVGGWSYAEFSDFQPLMDFRAIPTNRAVSYEVVATGPRENRFTFADTAAILNASNYRLLTYNEQVRLSSENLYNIRGAYAFNRDPGDRGFGFELGGEYRRIDRMRDNSRTDYNVGTTPLGPYAIQTNFRPDWVNFPLLWVNGPEFIRDGVPSLKINQASTATQAVISDYRYVEDTKAGFVLGQYRGDRIALVGGLRYENVNTLAQTPGENLAAPFLNRRGGYDKWLPSATFSYEMAERLFLKFAASRSLGRPNPGDIAQRERRNDDTLTITRGNPNLRPRVSANYDAALEYYLPERNGLISLALFQKNIRDEIFTQTSVETIDGADYQVREPRNAKGSKVSGVEFGMIVNSLGFLTPSLAKLGVSGNVTYTAGSIAYIDPTGSFSDFPYLEDQARLSANASVFYEFSKAAELRLSYSHRGRYYDSIPTTAWTATGRAPFGQLGAYFRYDATDKLTFKFRARNLLSANGRRVRGIGLGGLHEEVEFGQSFYADVQYRF